jgi:hypothetical protein
MAGAFLVLGITFFIQKSVKPVISVVLVALAVALGSGAFVLNRSPAESRVVRIVEPNPGDTVAANDRVPLEVVLSGAPLATSASADEGGHLHVYVDGELVDMPTTLEPEVEMEPGRHTLTVEYVDNEHKRFDPRVTDQIEIRAR